MWPNCYSKWCYGFAALAIKTVQWALPCPSEVSEISWPAINWELSVKNAVVWRLGKKSPLEALLPVHRQVVQVPRLRWLQDVPGLLYARGWGFCAPSQPTGPACDCLVKHSYLSCWQVAKQIKQLKWQLALGDPAVCSGLKSTKGNIAVRELWLSESLRLEKTSKIILYSSCTKLRLSLFMARLIV